MFAGKVGDALESVGDAQVDEGGEGFARVDGAGVEVEGDLGGHLRVVLTWRWVGQLLIRLDLVAAWFGDCFFGFGWVNDYGVLTDVVNRSWNIDNVEE